MMRFSRMFRRLAAAAILLLPIAGQAALQEDLERCAAIGDDSARLSCFDRLAYAAREATEPAGEPLPTEAKTERGPSPMQRHWEIGEHSGILRFRAHKPIYFLPARYSGNPNQKPLPSLIAQDPDLNDLDLQDVEAKFQLSFKLKMIRGIFGGRADLWLGYTQQSHWQVYNQSISRPFRETDYEPELMLVAHTDYNVFGLHGRFVNLGVVHQSNGRAEPLSRSWNRIYLQVGLERGGFGLYLRPWYRLQEDEDEDDNPDIEDYYGYGDLVVQYTFREHTLAALARGNVSEGHGALQLDWTFPLYGPVRGYLQGFTGYGESLIDYNHEQTTVGAGISFNGWF